MRRSSIPYRIASGLVTYMLFPRGTSYSDREWQGRGDSNTPSNIVVSFYRLPQVECHDEEGSLLVAIHQSNPWSTNSSDLCFLDTVIHGITVLQFIWTIKKRRRLHVPLSCSLLGKCHSGYVTPLWHSRDVWRRYFLIFLVTIWKSSWTIFDRWARQSGDDFDSCLAHLTKILKAYVRKRLV